MHRAGCLFHEILRIIKKLKMTKKLRLEYCRDFLPNMNVEYEAREPLNNLSLSVGFIDYD